MQGQSSPVQVKDPYTGSILMHIGSSCKHTTEFSITPIWAYYYACFLFRTPKIRCHGFSITPCFFLVTRPKFSINYVMLPRKDQGRIAARHCSKIKQVIDTCHRRGEASRRELFLPLSNQSAVN